MIRNRFKGLTLLTVIFVIFTMACFIPADVALAEQDGTFTGTWTATGNWQPLDFKEGRDVSVFKLSGHINLKNEIGKIKDFWAECVGLSDSQTGSAVRCIWRDINGKEAAYVVLHGQQVKKGVKVAGEFIGGAGALKTLTGTLSFTWSSVYINQRDHILTGYTNDISGSYRIAKAEN